MHAFITLCHVLSQLAHGCRQYIHTKTGQDLPKEDAGLEELVAAYKGELGLSDKEAVHLEHLQVSRASTRHAHELSCCNCSNCNHCDLEMIAVEVSLVNEMVAELFHKLCCNVACLMLPYTLHLILHLDLR